MINMCVYGMMIALVLLGLEAVRDQKNKDTHEKKRVCGCRRKYQLQYSTAQRDSQMED